MAGLEKIITSLLNNEIPECRPGTLAFENLMSRWLNRKNSNLSKCEIMCGLIRSAMLERNSARTKGLSADV
jgi:hypothetical protein